MGEQNVRDENPVDRVKLIVGFGLVPFFIVSSSDGILERIKTIRKEIENETGTTLPKIRIQDDIHLEPNDYTIVVDGNEVVHRTVASKAIVIEELTSSLAVELHRMAAA